MLINLSIFKGLVPRVAARKLGGEHAQDAVDCNLLNGDLRSWNGMLFSWTPTKVGVINTIYRYAQQYWFHWLENVDVVRSPGSGNTTDRVIFTGVATGPKITDNSIAVQGGGANYPNNAYDLGIPAPALAPAVSAGNKNPDPAMNESRVYVETYVSAWGEEGAPSPTSAVIEVDPNLAARKAFIPVASYTQDEEVDPSAGGSNNIFFRVTGVTGAGAAGAEPAWPTIAGQTVVTGEVTFTAISKAVELSNLNAIPAGNYNINKRRIYRSADSGLGASFFLVAELPVSQTTYTDMVDGITLASNGSLKSATWDMPPADLFGIIGLPNGVVAGISGSELCLSVPYQPHAWPVSQRYSVNWPIVGIGAFGNSVAIGTTGLPYVASVAEPTSVFPEKIEKEQACVSKRGIVDMGYAIAYPSPDGLMTIGIGSSDLATRAIMNREDWQKYNPSSIHAYFNDGRYIAFYDATPIGGIKGGFILDPKNPDAGLTHITTYATSGYTDRENDALYLIVNGAIVEWDTIGQPKLTATWKSGVYTTPVPVNMGVAQVKASSYPVTFKLFADGLLVHTQVVADHLAFRLPAGYLADEWEVELSGASDIHQCLVGTSFDDIRAL